MHGYFIYLENGFCLYEPIFPKSLQKNLSTHYLILDNSLINFFNKRIKHFLNFNERLIEFFIIMHGYYIYLENGFCLYEPIFPKSLQKNLSTHYLILDIQ